MVILKGFLIMGNTNIAFIGPRQHAFGGYNTYRFNTFKDDLLNVLLKLKETKQLKAHTNLMTISELSFAAACLANNIPYNVYLPCIKFENKLPDITEHRDLFNKLLTAADQVEVTGKVYTLDKIKHCRAAMMDAADIILFYPNPIRYSYEFLSAAFIRNKRVVVL